MFRLLRSGFDADDPVGPDGGAVRNAGRNNQAIAGTELDCPVEIGKGENDASLDAKEGLAVGMGVDGVDLSRPVQPTARRKMAAFKKSDHLRFGKGMFVGPVDQVDPAGEQFMIRGMGHE